MDLHVFPIPIPPTISLPILSLWVFPVTSPEHFSLASNLDWWSVLSQIIFSNCYTQNLLIFGELKFFFIISFDLIWFNYTEIDT